MPHRPANSLLPRPSGGRLNVDASFPEPDPTTIHHQPVEYDDGDEKSRKVFLEQKAIYDEIRKRGAWNIKRDLE